MDRRERAGSFYTTSEFVGEVGVLVGEHPAFDVGFGGQLQIRIGEQFSRFASRGENVTGASSALRK
jgi:hypothetical protein